MLRAMYDLQLQHMIRPGRAVVGEFTEGEMYFAAANMANKVSFPNNDVMAERS
jgi:hypothetical protein